VDTGRVNVVGDYVNGGGEQVKPQDPIGMIFSCTNIFRFFMTSWLMTFLYCCVFLVLFIS
jgi:hypothetical protein